MLQYCWWGSTFLLAVPVMAALLARCGLPGAEAGVAAIPLGAFRPDGQPTRFIRLCFAKSDAVLDDGAARLNAARVAQLVVNEAVGEQKTKDTFISTRELQPAQVARLGELGFDQHHCWPKPITT